MGFQIYTYGDPAADTLLIQMVDDHDMEGIEREVARIRELTAGQNFCLKAVKVSSWNQDLSPWAAPAVFGNEDFGEGAADTLAYVLREVAPAAGESLSADGTEGTEPAAGRREPEIR